MLANPFFTEMVGQTIYIVLFHSWHVQVPLQRLGIEFGGTADGETLSAALIFRQSVIDISAGEDHLCHDYNPPFYERRQWGYEILLRAIALQKIHSNTSHVIVYRITWIPAWVRYLFKYISCYCLSVYGHRPSVRQSPFKYISCYCLSINDSHD